MRANDAEAVNQRVGVGDFQRINHQQDIGVVFLADAVAQTGGSICIGEFMCLHLEIIQSNFLTVTQND